LLKLHGRLLVHIANPDLHYLPLALTGLVLVFGHLTCYSKWNLGWWALPEFGQQFNVIASKERGHGSKQGHSFRGGKFLTCRVFSAS